MRKDDMWPEVQPPKINKCDCHSYNGDFGSVPEVRLRILSSISPEGEKTYKNIMVDACIASVVEYLIGNEVNTIGSCCGHGKNSPSIVLGESTENYSQIRKWIAEKDDRYFELSQWKRVLV